MRLKTVRISFFTSSFSSSWSLSARQQFWKSLVCLNSSGTQYAAKLGMGGHPKQSINLPTISKIACKQPLEFWLKPPTVGWEDLRPSINALAKNLQGILSVFQLKFQDQIMKKEARLSKIFSKFLQPESPKDYIQLDKFWRGPMSQMHGMTDA